MTTLTKNSKLQLKIDALKVLSRDLDNSLLIESIWPDAFKHGKVKFSGIQKHSYKFFESGLAFTQSWFIDGAGHKHYLTAEELKQFKPDALIHKDYKVYARTGNAVIDKLRAINMRP